MIRSCLRVRVLALLVGLLAALTIAAALAEPAHASDAYETVILDDRSGLSDAYRVRARVLWTPAGSRIGCRGYARVQVVNPTEKAHAVGLVLSPGHQPWDHSYRRTLAVPAGGTASVDLPLPFSRFGTELVFTLDGRAVDDVVYSSTGARRRSSALSILTITPGGRDAPAWERYVEEQVKRVANAAKVTLVSRAPDELPTSWTLLAGFDLVLVVEGATLTPAQETVLARYVAGGGLLVFGTESTAADGPLDRLRTAAGATAEEGGGSHGHHGLGRWFRLGRAWGTNSPLLREWFYEGASVGTAVGSRTNQRHVGGMPDKFWLPLRIPGVDAAPTGVFFLLILLFAVVVGPLSYLYFRKRRRLPMLLVSIPVLGFVCTVGILLYGIFSEGFGVMGVVRSFSVLDQEAHLASAFSASTLYAGLQPAALQPRPDSVVHCASFTRQRRGQRGSQATLQVDLDAGFRMRGSILPSRTPTPFVATTVGRARQRLRFRRREDGTFEILAAPEFAPLRARGSVLLRTQEGAYYLLAESGFLKPASRDVDVTSALRDIPAAAADLPLGGGEYIDSDAWYPTTRYLSAEETARVSLGQSSLPGWLGGRLGRLPPGSYLARMQQPPLPENFGLEVDYRRQEHVVFGLLGPEDILDE